MKLVITAEGPAPSDRVDPRFGRARYLIQFDSLSEQYLPLDNTARAEAVQGAGVRAAQDVVDRGAGALLTGHCGPKAFAVLAAAGITVYSGFDGTIREAVTAWENGTLEPLAAPDGFARR